MARKLKKIYVPDSQGNLVEYEVDGVDASTASEGQVLTADGQGGADWGDILAESVPTNVRRAIYDMLSDISDDEANLAIVDQWVQNSIITSLKLTPTSLTFNGLETKRITAKATPATADISGLTWESSNTNVATVSNGAVTSVRNGSCTITASISGITASCSVTVTGIVYPALDSYGENLLLSVSNTLNTLNPNKDKLAFGFVSDTHRSHDGVVYDSSAGNDSDRNSLKLLARIANAGLLDCVFHGGDMASGRDENADYVKECIEATMDDMADYYSVPVYATVGNHDKRYNTSRDIQSNAYLKSQILKGIKSKTGQSVTWIDDTNYYIDFAGYSHPIRIIVINEYDNIEAGSSASASTAANCTGAWIAAATIGTSTHNISSANAANTILGFVYHGMTYAQIKTTAEAYIEAGGYAVLGSFGGHVHHYSSDSTDGFNNLLVTYGFANSDEINSNDEYGVSVFVVDPSSENVDIKWLRIGRDSATVDYYSLMPIVSEGIMPSGSYKYGPNSTSPVITITNNNKHLDLSLPWTGAGGNMTVTNPSKNAGSRWSDFVSKDNANTLFEVKTGDTLKTVVNFSSLPTDTTTSSTKGWAIVALKEDGEGTTSLISLIPKTTIQSSTLSEDIEYTITAEEDFDIKSVGFAGYGGATSSTYSGTYGFDLQIYLNDTLLTMGNINNVYG